MALPIGGLYHLRGACSGAILRARPRTFDTRSIIHRRLVTLKHCEKTLKIGREWKCSLLVEGEGSGVMYIL